MTIIYDRAGYEYALVPNYAAADGLTSFVTFMEDGTPVVIRNGQPVLSSFFTDGNGRWGKLINSTDPKKVEKVLKKAENPAIALHNGEIVCQLIPLTGIVWHDDMGNKFYLVSRFDREELEADNLAYVTAESEGTYETIKYIAYNGTEFIDVPRYLYNEKNKRFTVGANFKAMAYAEMRRRGNASIAVKNGARKIYARLSEKGEYIMAHTQGAYEGQKHGDEGSYFVEYCGSTSGGWNVPKDEFPKRYQFYGADEQGRAIYISTDARYVWCHLFGDFIGCIPQWGDSMVAMTNPQINITNPDDVYACSYIEFFGKEDMPGGYIIVQELFLGAPEHFVIEFTETLKGYLTTECGVPKQLIKEENLSDFLRKTLGVPSVEGVQAKVASATAA